MTINLQSNWDGGKAGKGTVKSDNFSAVITIPAVYGGQGTDSNPKELFVASTASCFIATLTAIIEGKKLEISSLSVDTQAKSDDDDFSIVHTANIVLPQGAAETEFAKAKSLVTSADDNCTVGNLARKAGVEVSVIANIS